MKQTDTTLSVLQYWRTSLADAERLSISEERLSTACLIRTESVG